MKAASAGASNTFCARHWKKVLDARPVAAPLAATILLTQRFIAKVDATFPHDLSLRDALERMNAELQKRAPLCCYLGEEAVDEVIIMAQAAGSAVQA